MAPAKPPPVHALLLCSRPPPRSVPAAPVLRTIGHGPLQDEFEQLLKALEAAHHRHSVREAQASLDIGDEAGAAFGRAVGVS